MTQQSELTGLGALDKGSPVPLYYQLKEILRHEVEGGHWQPGQRIPSEMELCEAFGVSRTVVRQALQELEHHGLLYRQRGKGTFVAEPKISESLVQDLSGFHEDMLAKGHAPVTEVLTQEVRPAGRKTARCLEIEPDDEVIFIERVRSVGGEPIVLVTTHLPHQMCPGLLEEDLSSQSLYALLEQKYGLLLSHGRRTIEAVAANQYEAERLGVDEGSPLILLDSVSRLEDGRPVECFHALHRGDRSRFEVEVVRTRYGADPLKQAIELPPATSLSA